MAGAAESLDDFVEGVWTQDVKRRFTVHIQLVSYLSDPLSCLKSDDLDRFVEGLAGWVSCSNFKVSLNGLEVLCVLVDRLGEEFKPHITTVLPSVIDRLGDAKDQVREQAQQLLLKLMMPASSPQYVYERISGAFTHKLWLVREGVLFCLQNTINRYGARSLHLSKTVPQICKLLDDQNGQVREAAVVTLTEIYRHVGEKVRTDLTRKGISAHKLSQIFGRFDEVKMSGNMLPTADIAPSRAGEDEVDFARPQSTKVLQTRRTGGPGSASKSRTTGPSPRNLSSAGSSSAAAAGAMDEELFIKSFEDVPKVKLFSSRDMTEQMSKVNSILSDSNQDWEKRVDYLKILRALVMNGAAEHDDFPQQLRTLEPAFVMSVKDLRSQVVREACITIAYMTQQLSNKMDRTAEAVLPALFNLLPNSAKIMATSGCVCIRFIIQFVHTSRLVPIVTSNMSVKSNVIRRHSCEFLNQLLHTWATHTLEKHIAILQDSIRRGISDADSEARVFSRKAFWGFSEHFKSQADALLGSLDPSKQKMLQGELSNSSSNNSLNSADSQRPKSRARSASQDRSAPKYGNLDRTGSIRKPAASRISSSRSDAGSDVDVMDWEPQKKDVSAPISPRTPVHMVRSRSDIDLSGVKAKVNSNRPRHATQLGVHRMEKGNTASLPRPKTSSMGSNRAMSNLVTPERSGRTRSRIGVSQSQPGSRSTSPSSRGSYITHTQPGRDPMTPKGKRKTGIPRSQGTSREASPNRHTYGRERRLSGSKIPGHSGPGLMSQRVLHHGSDVEDALNDALSRPNRKRYDMYDSDDAASETSSLCSERSYSSYSGRTSEDMSEILALLGSGSYTERKDGLVSLTHLLRSSRYLSRMELKKVTEVFNRMFHDPHSKVFSLFLDTLSELCLVHGRELTDWLYILLTRLLNKTGTDMLGSVSAKLMRTLETVRDTFPCDSQFNTLTKFIIDQTQSPNLKVKNSMLNYLHGLIMVMEAGDFVNTMDTRLAVSRIINWTMEPRNVDIRKSAQLVLIALFNLNPPEFSLMLAALPKAFQDGATKILHSHMRSASECSSDILSPRNATSPVGQQRSRPPSRQSMGHPEDCETENMNPEDIYNSIKKTSADIQNLSLGTSKLDCGYEVDIKKKRDFASQDSGIQELRNDSPDGLDSLSRRGGGHHQHHAYNPHHYQDEGRLNGFGKSLLTEDNDPALCDKEPSMSDVLRELSNHNERVRERRKMLDTLLKWVRSSTISEDHWDEHFKSILLILIETFSDTDKSMRMDALIVFRSILKRQAARFKEYAELTILKICEAHKDPSKDPGELQVQRAAEECALVIPTAINPEQALPILNNIIHTAKFPIHWAAIKMQVEVVKLVPNEVLERSLPNTVPGLIMGYDDTDSRVRKAAVFCLVNIYLQVGESLRPYLQDLNTSKTKLLNLYIKRAQEDSRSGIMSPVASDT